MSKIIKKAQSSKYQILNWPEYNQSLINRGSITFWIDTESLENWYYEGPNQKGGQYVYSDLCIECILGLKTIFKLPYRQSIGFTKSIIDLMVFKEVKVPSYSQVSRRAKDLEIELEVPTRKTPLYVVCDSTGLKVYGEGEWKTRKHGYSKRRTWRKLHLGVDEKTGFICAQTLTENSVDDASQLEPILEQIEDETDKLSADGAYDRKKCWDLLEKWDIEGVIPPRKDAVYWVDEHGELLDYQRNHVLKKIDELGEKEWKKQSGYHRRSLSETAMMRFKVIFGNKLFSRKLDRQKTEAAIKVKMMNRMTGIGMPISKKVS